MRRAGRKVIVEFPAALLADTERATRQLSINRSTLIRDPICGPGVSGQMAEGGTRKATGRGLRGQCSAGSLGWGYGDFVVEAVDDAIDDDE